MSYRVMKGDFVEAIISDSFTTKGKRYLVEGVRTTVIKNSHIIEAVYIAADDGLLDIFSLKRFKECPPAHEAFGNIYPSLMTGGDKKSEEQAAEDFSIVMGSLKNAMVNACQDLENRGLILVDIPKNPWIKAEDMVGGVEYECNKVSHEEALFKVTENGMEVLPCDKKYVKEWALLDSYLFNAQIHELYIKAKFRRLEK